MAKHTAFPEQIALKEQMLKSHFLLTDLQRRYFCEHVSLYSIEINNRQKHNRVVQCHAHPRSRELPGVGRVHPQFIPWSSAPFCSGILRALFHLCLLFDFLLKGHFLTILDKDWVWLTSSLLQFPKSISNVQKISSFVFLWTPGWNWRKWGCFCQTRFKFCFLLFFFSNVALILANASNT